MESKDRLLVGFQDDSSFFFSTDILFVPSSQPSLWISNFVFKESQCPLVTCKSTLKNIVYYICKCSFFFSVDSILMFLLTRSKLSAKSAHMAVLHTILGIFTSEYKWKLWGSLTYLHVNSAAKTVLSLIPVLLLRKLTEQLVPGQLIVNWFRKQWESSAWLQFHPVCD